MAHEAKHLIRLPDDWARDHGWISRRRAVNLAARLEALASAIDGAGSHEDEGFAMWAKEIRSIGKTIAPALTPAQKRAAKNA